MKLPISLICLLLSALSPSSARKQPEKVLLSNIRSLTLRSGLKTSHNRVTPIPQLKCTGGTAKGLYDIDVLRCKNGGSSYDDADVEWTCTASLPAEFKLGSTDVICEGFNGPDDRYVLKGSCGVEYRLMLTSLGEEKYGRKGSDTWSDFPGRTKGGDAAAFVFWIAFIGVVVWILYAAFWRDRGLRRPGNRLGHGGWGNGGGGDDPPPPYDPRPPPAKKTYTAPQGARGQAAQEAWRPGFWTGALGGAAAGYMAGNRGGRAQQERSHYPGTLDNGEGSSGGRTRSGGSSLTSSSYGSSRHESTGFGGTTRR